MTTPWYQQGARSQHALDRGGARCYLCPVSPTVFRARGFRFYFLSLEEPRLHVHVQRVEGEAKFRLEPVLELAQNYGLRADQLRTAERPIKEHEDEFRAAWRKHFSC